MTFCCHADIANYAAVISRKLNKPVHCFYTREQEFQADTIGIRMIGNAGYDPYAASRFLETMALYRGVFQTGLTIPSARPAFFGPPWATQEEIDAEVAANSAQFTIKK